MENQLELATLIGNPESAHLEYKAVLPPARTLGQLISSFANADGGIIILGVAEVHGRIKVNGLSEDFRASAIIHKALDMLSPRPTVDYDNYSYTGKRVYVIQVKASPNVISIEGKYL